MEELDNPRNFHNTHDKWIWWNYLHGTFCPHGDGKSLIALGESVFRVRVLQSRGPQLCEATTHAAACIYMKAAKRSYLVDLFMEELLRIVISSSNYFLFSGIVGSSKMFRGDHFNWLLCLSHSWTSMVPISFVVFPADVKLLLLWREPR